MKKATKRLILLFVFILILLVVTLIFSGKFIIDLVFEDACANELIQTLPSPNDERTAYIFKRDCGATTDYSYHLTILKADDAFKNKAGNAFISGTEFTVEWLTDWQLDVHHAPYADTHKLNRKVNGVQIEYVINPH